MKPLPSKAHLHEGLDYDPATGVLHWKVRPRHHFKTLRAMHTANSRDAHKVAGTVSARGYRRVMLARVFYLAHRLIWKMMTGMEPAVHIDHKNGIGDDNRWKNLREATHAQNLRNMRKHSDNTSGFKGVIYVKRLKSYQSMICLDGVNRYLGLFSTAEQAHAAYQAAALQLHGEFANFGLHVAALTLRRAS